MPALRASFIQCVAFCEEQNATLHLRLTLRGGLERSTELHILILGLHLPIDLHDELIPRTESP